MTMIIRRYDIPISYRWYEIVIEVEKESGRRKIFLDSALKVEDQVYQLVAHILDIEGTKILIKDFDDNFGYTVMVGDKTLEQHIHDHAQDYSTWEVTLKCGAKTKVVTNKDPKKESVFFRGKKLPDIKTNNHVLKSHQWNTVECFVGKNKKINVNENQNI